MKKLSVISCRSSVGVSWRRFRNFTAPRRRRTCPATPPTDGWRKEASATSRFHDLRIPVFLLTAYGLLLTPAAWAAEAAGRKAPQMELKCDQVGETLRCETEGLKLEMAPPKDADLPKGSGRELKDAYVKGYKRGLQESLLLREELTQAEHYVWKRPIVQKVWMPPMITSGVFVPGHHEFVLLKPGEWKLNIETEKEEK